MKVFQNFKHKLMRTLMIIMRQRNVKLLRSDSIRLFIFTSHWCEASLKLDEKSVKRWDAIVKE